MLLTRKRSKCTHLFKHQSVCLVLLNLLLFQLLCLTFLSTYYSPSCLSHYNQIHRSVPLCSSVLSNILSLKRLCCHRNSLFCDSLPQPSSPLCLRICIRPKANDTNLSMNTKNYSARKYTKNYLITVTWVNVIYYFHLTDSWYLKRIYICNKNCVKI